MYALIVQKSQKEVNMTADIQHLIAGMGTNRPRAGRTDACDTTRESLEGKNGSVERNVNVSEYT